MGGVPSGSDRRNYRKFKGFDREIVPLGMKYEQVLSLDLSSFSKPLTIGNVDTHHFVPAVVNFPVVEFSC